jgi:hypothetical protein
VHQSKIVFVRISLRMTLEPRHVGVVHNNISLCTWSIRLGYKFSVLKPRHISITKLSDCCPKYWQTILCILNNLFQSNTTRGSRVLHYLINNNNILVIQKTRHVSTLFGGHHQVLAMVFLFPFAFWLLFAFYISAFYTLLIQCRWFG